LTASTRAGAPTVGLGLPPSAAAAPFATTLRAGFLAGCAVLCARLCNRGNGMLEWRHLGRCSALLGVACAATPASRCTRSALLLQSHRQFAVGFGRSNSRGHFSSIIESSSLGALLCASERGPCKTPFASGLRSARQIMALFKCEMGNARAFSGTVAIARTEQCLHR